MIILEQKHADGPAGHKRTMLAIFRQNPSILSLANSY